MNRGVHLRLKTRSGRTNRHVRLLLATFRVPIRRRKPCVHPKETGPKQHSHPPVPRLRRVRQRATGAEDRNIPRIRSSGRRLPSSSVRKWTRTKLTSFVPGNSSGLRRLHASPRRVHKAGPNLNTVQRTTRSNEIRWSDGRPRPSHV